MHLTETDFLFALNHPLRRQALRLILEKGPLCVCHLTERLGSSQPALSRQMGILRERGLVESLRQGHWIYYDLSQSLPGWAREILKTLSQAMPEPSDRSSHSKENLCPTRDPLRLLFLCTQNACRSQIASGWARALGGSRVEVRSAGTLPHPEGVNPLAVSVMLGKGIDLSGQPSTALDVSLLQWANLVITVCGEADESCPALPPGVRKEHWPIADPDRIRGSSREIFQAFIRTRDEIEDRVRDLFRRLALPEISLPRKTMS